MDKCDSLKYEIDEKLQAARLTSEMKYRIKAKAACQKDESDTHIFFIRNKYRKVALIIGSIFIFTCSLMAMEYIGGLDIFFDSKNLNKAVKEIKNVQLSSENHNVKLCIDEMIIQPYDTIVSLSFSNETEQPWTEGTASKSLDVSFPGETKKIREGISEEDRKLVSLITIPGKTSIEDFSNSHYGILSEDGRRLSYCVEIGSHKKMEDSSVFISAKNLVQKQQINKNVEIPIRELYEAQGVEVDCNNYKFETAEDKFIKLLEDINKKKSSKRQILDKEYSSVYLSGVGFLANKKEYSKGIQTTNAGVVIYTKNEKYSNKVNEDTDAYIVGNVKEIEDIRTGKKYKVQEDHRLTDEISEGQVSASYFPDIEKSQMPYLQITQVSYEKQHIVAEGEWQIEIPLEKNKNLIKLEPDIKWNKGKYTTYIDEVYLSTMGVQMKMHTINSTTQKILGDIIEDIPIQAVTDSGSVISLENKSAKCIWNEDKKIAGYIVNYGQYDNQLNRYFLNVEDIDKIIIKGHPLQVKK